MPENDLNAKLGLDSTDFKTQIITLAREIRDMESGFRASAAGLGDWSNKSSGLELRAKSLTKQIEVQSEKTSRLSKEYERIAKEQGENSREAKELHIRLNKETETLNKMQTELGHTNTKLADMKKSQDEAGKATSRLKKSMAGLSDDLRGVFGKLKSFSNGVANMSKSIGNSVAHMGRTIGNTVGNIAQTVGRLTKYIGMIGLAAGAVVGGLLASTIGPASNLSETVSKVGVVFDTTSEKVLDFGKTAARAIGMSENAALSAAGTYGNLFRSMGIGNDASADMSIKLVELAGDLASFNNLNPEEVLDKLRSGLTGESEPLKTLGINIDQATIKAKAMELGLIKTGDEMTAAAKAQAVYALMFEQTALAQGDFARTSSGLANQQRIWSAQVENLRAKVGSGLAPTLAGLLKIANDILASDAVQEWAGSLAKSFEKVGPVLDTITKAFSSGGVNKGFATIGTTFKTMFPVLNVVLAPLGRVIGYISDLIGIIKGADSVSGAAEGIGGLIMKIFGDTITARTNMATMAVSFISGFLEGIIGALPALATIATVLLKAVVDGLLNAVPILIPVAIAIINQFVQFITQNLPMLIKAAVQLIVTLANGISAALPQMIPAVAEIIPLIILSLIENLPLLVEAALELIIALVDGLIIALPILIAAVPEIMNALIKAFAEMEPKIKEAGNRLLVTIVMGIHNALPRMINSSKEIVNIWLRGVKDNMSAFLSVGGDIVKGLWEGIVSKAQWLRDQLVGFFKRIIQGSKDTLQERSPSKVFAGIGANMALGLGAGFSNAFGQIERDINGAIGALNPTLSPSLAGVGAGGRANSPAPVSVSVKANVANNIDIYRLARQVAEEINKRR